MLKQDGVECIVAPYEADAQLAFLSQTGYVHAVISEDSDLLPFGCKRVPPFLSLLLPLLLTPWMRRCCSR